MGNVVIVIIGHCGVSGKSVIFVIMEESCFKYVVPVFDLIHTCGQGCFVGNTFITSGHVIGTETKYLFWNRERIPLDPKEALSIQIISEDKDENSQNDFALFNFNGINSPLKLSDSLPPVGVILDCLTWAPNNDMSEVNGFLKRVICKGEVVSHYYHFFSCRMELNLQEGASGSPLIMDNTVWGILSGHDESKCEDELFFQSTAFLR